MFLWKEGRPVRAECVDVRQRPRKDAGAAPETADTAGGEGG